MKNYLPTTKVTKLEWPRNSPDISPIKNLWDILKKKVADKQPSSASALVNAIKNVLIKKSRKVLPEPIDSKACCIQAVDTEQ